MARKDERSAHEHAQVKITPQQALDELLQGNKRFVDDKKGSFPINIAGTPFINGCMDSRAPPSLILDHGKVQRQTNAGNVVTNFFEGGNALAALEGTKIIMELGHTKCGAIAATFDWVAHGREIEDPHIQQVAHMLLPAIKAAITALKKGRDEDGNPVTTEEDAKNLASVINVRRMLDKIKKTKTIAELVDAGKVMVVGAIYDTDTGKVEVVEKEGSEKLESELDALLRGNTRFRIEHEKEIPEHAKGQQPPKMTIGCKDCPSSHMIFDQGLGEMFDQATAGIVVDDIVRGSAAFASLHGTRALVVLGHTDCTALSAAYDAYLKGKEIDDDSVKSVYLQLAPAVKSAYGQMQKQLDSGEVTEKEVLNRAAELNIVLQVASLMENETVRQKVQSGELMVVGALYESETGRVRLLQKQGGKSG